MHSSTTLTIPNPTCPFSKVPARAQLRTTTSRPAPDIRAAADGGGVAVMALVVRVGFKRLFTPSHRHGQPPTYGLWPDWRTATPQGTLQFRRPFLPLFSSTPPVNSSSVGKVCRIRSGYTTLMARRHPGPSLHSLPAMVTCSCRRSHAQTWPFFLFFFILLFFLCPLAPCGLLRCDSRHVSRSQLKSQS